MAINSLLVSVRVCMYVMCTYITVCMVQVVDEGKYWWNWQFLMIHQNFPYQIFLLTIDNVVPATLWSIFYLSNFLNAISSIFSLVKNLCHMVYNSVVILLLTWGHMTSLNGTNTMSYYSNRYSLIVAQQWQSLHLTGWVHVNSWWSIISNMECPQHPNDSYVHYTSEVDIYTIIHMQCRLTLHII